MRQCLGFHPKLSYVVFHLNEVNDGLMVRGTVSCPHFGHMPKSQVDWPEPIDLTFSNCLILLLPSIICHFTGAILLLIMIYLSDSLESVFPPYQSTTPKLSRCLLTTDSIQLMPRYMWTLLLNLSEFITTWMWFPFLHPPWGCDLNNFAACYRNHADQLSVYSSSSRCCFIFSLGKHNAYSFYLDIWENFKQEVASILDSEGEPSQICDLSLKLFWFLIILVLTYYHDISNHLVFDLISSKPLKCKWGILPKGKFLVTWLVLVLWDHRVIPGEDNSIHGTVLMWFLIAFLRFLVGISQPEPFVYTSPTKNWPLLMRKERWIFENREVILTLIMHWLGPPLFGLWCSKFPGWSQIIGHCMNSCVRSTQRNIYVYRS